MNVKRLPRLLLTIAAAAMLVACTDPAPQQISTAPATENRPADSDVDLTPPATPLRTMRPTRTATQAAPEAGTGTRPAVATATATPVPAATETAPVTTPTPQRPSASATPSEPAGEALIVDHTSVQQFEQIPEEYLEAAAGLRFIFRHASVGYNVDMALNCLMNNFERRPNACDRGLDQDSIVYGPQYDRSNWHFEFHSQPNANPGWWNKTAYFVERMNSLEADESYDVMAYIMAYVDATPGSDLPQKFFNNDPDDNLPSIEDVEAVQAAHPDTTLMWWTLGLARTIGSEEALSFNEQMRDYVRANGGVLLDIADIESHAPDGTPCTDAAGNGLPALCAQYTEESQGGHLNTLGSQRVARALWVMMARLAGWDGNQGQN